MSFPCYQYQKCLIVFRAYKRLPATCTSVCMLMLVLIMALALVLVLALALPLALVRKCSDAGVCDGAHAGIIVPVRVGANVTTTCAPT